MISIYNARHLFEVLDCMGKIGREEFSNSGKVMWVNRAKVTTRKVLPLIFALLVGICFGFLSPFAVNRLNINFWVFAILALVFPTIIFIYVIKKKRGTANLLWLVTMLGTSLSFRRRDPGLLATSEVIDAQVIAQLTIYIVCGLFVLYWFIHHPTQFRRFLKVISNSPIKWMVIFGIFALLSTTYSTHRALTFVSSLQLITVIFLLGVIIMSDKAFHKAIMTTTVMGLLLIEAVVWVLYFVAPELAITVQWPNLRRLGGLLIHPNGLGVVAAVVAVVALSRGLIEFQNSGRLTYLGVFLGSVVTLIATQGRADLVAGLLGSMVVLGLQKRKFLLLLSMIILLSIILFLPGTAEWGGEKFARGQDIRVLTGRVYVWEFVLSQTVRSFQSLFLGYGFGVSRLSLIEQGVNVTHTHNAFIEALMGMGIFGSFVLAMSYLSLGLFLLRRLLGSRGENFNFYTELLAVFVVIVVISMTSVAVAGRVNISSFIYLSVVACCVRGILRRKV